MNRKLVLFCAVTLPLAFFAVSVQAVQFHALQQKVVFSEKSQADWVEKNKKALAGITVMSSPKRIEELAVGQLKLKENASIKVRFTQ